MRILICGASGFVGRHLYKALAQAGHDCRRGVRQVRDPSDVAIDYTRDLSPERWLPRLADIEVVINAIGVLRDSRKQPMQQIFAEAPMALFKACATAGVKRIINISALGVGGAVDTLYFRCKRQAEQQLEVQGNLSPWLNLRPSLIHGADGSSTALFRLLARLPVQPLLLGGRPMLQPVHVDDLAQACVNWLAQPDVAGLHVDAVGAEPCSLRMLLDSYRQQLGYGPAWHLPVPEVLLALAAKCGDYVPFSPLCSDNLVMLKAGSTAAPDDFAALLGRKPVAYQQLIVQDHAA